MAYIEPNSIIMLCRGVPLEPDYTHTVWFNDAGAQQFAIGSRAKYTLQPNTYQRVNKNTCRVGLKADLLYDCNYMAFQNTNFGTKWFYAFIVEVNYVNNECTEIVYEIDSFQSYLFDIYIGDCFVEREHTITDELGANIIEEGLNVGDYVYDDYRSLKSFGSINFQDTGVMVMDSNDTDGGRFYGDSFQGVFLKFFEQSDVNALKTLLHSYNLKPEVIVDMYMCPNFGIQTINDHIVGTIPTQAEARFTAITGEEMFGNYKPKNKKMYTAPYMFFHCDNGSGDALNLRYELFANFRPSLQFYMSYLPPVSVVAFPKGYKGTNAGGGLDPGQSMNAESISLRGWGECSWSANNYKLGVLSTIVKEGMGMAGTVMGGIFPSTTTSVGEHIKNVEKTNKKGETLWNTDTKSTYASQTTRDMGGEGIASVGQSIGNVFRSVLSSGITTQGTPNGGTALACGNDLDFYIGRCRITEDYARTIDDYFTMYGYKVNKLKRPEINTRPHWNYVKVSYADIHGNAPAEHIENMKRALVRGITFWKSMSEVGDYHNYDNSPY